MQSTLAPVPARLGVIPARASPWECSCMERIWVRWQGAGVSLWPCPVCPHWLLWSQTSLGWVQEQRDLECALQSQPPAGIGFPVRPAKGHCSFLSPLTTAGPFTCSWTWKVLGGLCEEEEGVRGRKTSWQRHICPSRDRVLGLASASQLSLGSTQLFHVCLQITTVSFFNFFFQCKVANQQSYFGAELLPGGALSVTAGGHVAVPAPAPAGLAWQGEQRNPGIIKNKWSRCLQWDPALWG